MVAFRRYGELVAPSRCPKDAVSSGIHFNADERKGPQAKRIATGLCKPVSDGACTRRALYRSRVQSAAAVGEPAAGPLCVEHAYADARFF